MDLLQETDLVDTWLVLGWPRSNPPNPKSSDPPSSVMDLDEPEEGEGGGGVDDKREVPGTLDMVAGEELEPSSSRTN